MNTSFPAPRIALARGELLNLDGARGARIVSHCGTVWITQDGDLRDIVLQKGEAFELDRATPAIVQAFEASTVTIAEPTTPPRRRGGTTWAHRLGAAARRLATRPAWA